MAKRIQIIESLKIEDLAEKGRGVGRENGRVVFVAKTIPGDIVDVRVIKKRRAYLEAKKIADEYLVASGLNYAILRPGTLKNDPGTGKVKIAGKLNEGGKISREDVARVIVAALNDDTANNETFEIIEGETLIGKALHGVSA